MTPTELLSTILNMVGDQLRLPEQYAWAPAVFVGVTLLGLLMLTRGARWAPGLAALTFLAIGGFGGKALAGAIGTPLWPTVAVAAAIGGVLGVVMFRFWQALMLATCCILVGYGVYFGQSLKPEANNWLTQTADNGTVTLEPAGAVVGENQLSALDKLGGLWDHLEASVPDFAKNTLILVLATGIAGLVFGLLLPRLSRSLWAATVGTVVFGVGATALLEQYSPGTIDWLTADNMRAWMVVGVIWALSLAMNFATCSRGRKKEPADNTAEGEPAAA